MKNFQMYKEKQIYLNKILLKSKIFNKKYKNKN